MVQKTVVLGEASEESDNEEIVDRDETKSPKRMTNEHPNQFVSLLHRTLYVKNQQLYASTSHLFRHPIEKASKDIHNISHRLVDIQRVIQGLETAISKIGREQKNLDIDINMIV